MTILDAATVFFLLPYILLIGALTVGWHRASRVRLGVKKTRGITRISVIIPFRNESAHVDRLLSALVCQNFPAERWEVIAVNDHSQDDTLERLHRWQAHAGISLRVLENTSGENGKKAALSRGIEQACGDLIVTTDADCQMGAGWLRQLSAYYEHHQPYLMFSPVLFEADHPEFFTRLQSLEAISLLATAAGSSQMQRPVFCNAANMAFPKDIYQQLKDPMLRHIASGDDTMLLLSIKKLDPSRIKFNPGAEAVVTTSPMDTVHEFWNQRKRWVSKSRHYRDPDILVAGALVVLANLWLALLAAGSLFSSTFTTPLVAGFLVKMSADALLIWPTAAFFNRHHLMWSFLPGQLLYPFYSTLSAIVGWTGGFTWKNRHYHVN